MNFFSDEERERLEKFVKDCMKDEILEVKRRVHRLWDAQEEMMRNDLMLYNRNARHNENTMEKPCMLENYLSLEEALAELEHLAPKAYAIWIELFNEGKNTYISDPIHNLVVEGSAWEKTFDTFGQLYLDKPGYLLDIGCGPQAIPYYLRNFPNEYIYGIDPLLPFEEHPFHFTQGIAEFIPFRDESFDYIVSATSLDHVLLLDKALDEMHRVLRKNGVLLIWASTGENYTENPMEDIVLYDPYREDIEAVDACHMFHIGPRWFEMMMKDKWDKESHYSDRYNNHFYAFRKKEEGN